MAKKTISLQIEEEVVLSMQLLAQKNARSRTAEIGVALKKYIMDELGEAEPQSKKLSKEEQKEGAHISMGLNMCEMPQF